MVVIGIDPGSISMGYGIIKIIDKQPKYCASGCIKVSKAAMPERVKQIFQDVNELTEQYQPEQAAIEDIFVHTNAGGALKLGQARGAALAALSQYEISINEYSARQVKKAIVGTGAADKQQIQHMVKLMLNLSTAPPTDAADALAIALCHINTQQVLTQNTALSKYSRKRWRL